MTTSEAHLKVYRLVLESTYPGWAITYTITPTGEERWQAIPHREVTEQMRQQGILEQIVQHDAISLTVALSSQARMLDRARGYRTFSP